MDNPYGWVVQANLKSTGRIELGQTISLRCVELHPEFRLNRKAVLRRATALTPLQTFPFRMPANGCCRGGRGEGPP